MDTTEKLVAGTLSIGLLVGLATLYEPPRLTRPDEPQSTDLASTHERAVVQATVATESSPKPVVDAGPIPEQPAPSSRSGCEETEGCKEFGECAGAPPTCHPGSNEDCRQSTACANHAWCTLKAGRCQRVSDDDCSRATACSERGNCTLTYTSDYGEEPSWACRPGKTEDCRKSAGCRSTGRCTWDGPGVGRGKCRAMSDDDCRQSEFCRTSGFCKLVDGQCS